MRLSLPRSKRSRLLTGAGVLVLVAALAVAGVAYEHNRTGSIYHPHARFIPQPTPTLPKPKRASVAFSWPLFGYDKNHTRFFPAQAALKPPFRSDWKQVRASLLEFPPVISDGRLFQLADNGVLRATSTHTGATLWTRKLGTLSASSPAIDGRTLFATVLEGSQASGSGRVYALDAATGKIRWTRDLSSASESSPLVDHGRVFFGSQNGTVYALGASNGDVIWTYHAGGSVKASPTLSGGVLYFGDYSGELQAVSERSGRRLWISGSGGALLGSGTFYSTAAVIYGRVYLGNTDGRIYAYDASSGRLDWAVQTGSYVYASPAVTNAPGIGPTVYAGSYDGTFYAINARSGHISWTFDAHGKISGSPTILGDIVYFADLGTHKTYGLSISTGRVLFLAGTGSFDAVTTDGHNIYLTGVDALYALTPSAKSSVGRGTARAKAKGAGN